MIPETLREEYRKLHWREQVRILVMLKYGRSTFGPLTPAGNELFKQLGVS